MSSTPKLTFLFAFLLAISFTNVTANDLIDEICARTINPATCIELISGGNSTDLPDLGWDTAYMAKNLLESQISVIQSLLNGANDPKLKAIYSSCLKNYNDVLDNVTEFPRFMKDRFYRSMEAYASVAEKEPLECDKQFSSPSAEPSQLKDASDKVRTFCSAVAVIAKGLQNP